MSLVALKTTWEYGRTGRSEAGQPLRVSWPLHSGAGREAEALAWAAVAEAGRRSAFGQDPLGRRRQLTAGDVDRVGALGDCVDAVVAMAGKVVSKCHAAPRGILQKRHLHHHARVACI